MKFVSVRDLRSKSAEIWKRMSTEDMVVTSNGRPIAILSGVSEESLEQSLENIRTARAMQAVRDMQTISLKKGNDKMSLDEINAEIKQRRRSGKLKPGLKH